MATQNLTTADAILKDLYVGPIVEQINQKTYLLDQIQRDSDAVDHTGRRAIVPVHKDRNRGRGSIGDAGTLAVAGKQAWDDAIINIRYHNYGIELSDASIEATKRNEGAFVSLMEAESKGVAQDMKKDMNRQAFGVGSGLLGNVTSMSGSVITMTAKADVQYIQIGDPVALLVKSTGATSAGDVSMTVTDRDVSAHTITVSGFGGTAASIDTTYGVFLAGNYGNEMDGLRNITDSGRTLHSIDSTTAGNEYWDGNVIDAASTVVGESTYEQLADDVGQNGNGEVDVFLTTRGMKRRLADTYQSQKRFNDAQATRVHGGYSAIMVNEIPVVADDDCPKGYAFGLNKASFKWFQQTSPGFLESRDGQIFHLKPSATAGQFDSVWQAWFRWYVALGCVAPNRNGQIKNGTDDDPK
jgi:hypothetical protein